MRQVDHGCWGQKTLGRIGLQAKSEIIMWVVLSPTLRGRSSANNAIESYEMFSNV